MEAVTDFIFLGSIITADGDSTHESKRHLLLRRKAVTNLDSMLKSRDITLLTKVCIVKALIFPAVMYGCVHRRLSAEELMLSNYGVGEDSWRVPWIARRSNQSILKEINPEYSLEGLMLKLKLQYFGHLMPRAGSFEKTLMLLKVVEGWRQEEKGATEDEMVGWHHWLNGQWIWTNSGR